jgi:hypothetical protein
VVSGRALFLAFAFLGVLTALAPGKPSPASWANPAGAVLASAENILQVPPNAQRQMRYISLCSLPADRRENAWRALSGHCAELGSRKAITPLVAVTPDWCLLQVDTNNYGSHFAEVWEQLADADPFFHTDIQKTKQKRTVVQKEARTERRKRETRHDKATGKSYIKVNGEWQIAYRWDQQKNDWVPIYDAYEDVEVEKEVVSVTDEPVGDKLRAVFAPSGKILDKEGREKYEKVACGLGLKEEDAKQRTDGELLTYVLTGLTHSQVPVVDGQWFFKQTAINADRKPGYYDFLGVKNRADFELLVGFDEDFVSNKSRRTELLEAVSESGVSKKPRRIGSFDALGGFRYWKTFDNPRAVGKANPLRVLDKDNFEWAAEEAIGQRENGMLAWGLFVGKNPLNKNQKDGDLQDSAPDFIGYNHTAAGNDGRIHVNMGCKGCHYGEALGGKAGLMDISAWARTLFESPLALQSVDPEDLRKKQDQYLSDLLGPIDDARRVHARAVFQATGLTPAKWAQAEKDLWDKYEEAPITAEMAGRFLGVDVATFKAALFHELETTGKTDTVLAAFLKDKVIGSEQWEEAYPLAYQAVASYSAATGKGVQKP